MSDFVFVYLVYSSVNVHCTPAGAIKVKPSQSGVSAIFLLATDNTKSVKCSAIFGILGEYNARYGLKYE